MAAKITVIVVHQQSDSSSPIIKITVINPTTHVTPLQAHDQQKKDVDLTEEEDKEFRSANLLQLEDHTEQTDTINPKVHDGSQFLKCNTDPMWGTPPNK